MKRGDKVIFADVLERANAFQAELTRDIRGRDGGDGKHSVPGLGEMMQKTAVVGFDRDLRAKLVEAEPAVDGGPERCSFIRQEHRCAADAAGEAATIAAGERGRGI